MPADTPVVGHPAHAVATFRRTGNDFGVEWAEWVAQCGATGKEMGSPAFLRAGSCRKLELCSRCFPGRDHNACRLDSPVEID